MLSETLAQRIKWNRATKAVKILLYIFIILYSPVLYGVTMNYGTEDSPGQVSNVRALLTQPLVLSLFCPLEGVREQDMQGFPLKQSQSWCDYQDKFSAILSHDVGRPQNLNLYWWGTEKDKSGTVLAGLGS